MKLSIHAPRLLVLMFCGGANEMSKAAEVANTNALRVLVKLSKTEVRINELFIPNTDSLWNGCGVLALHGPATAGRAALGRRVIVLR